MNNSFNGCLFTSNCRTGTRIRSGLGCHQVLVCWQTEKDQHIIKEWCDRGYYSRECTGGHGTSHPAQESALEGWGLRKGLPRDACPKHVKDLNVPGGLVPPWQACTPPWRQGSKSNLSYLLERLGLLHRKMPPNTRVAVKNDTASPYPTTNTTDAPRTFA